MLAKIVSLVQTAQNSKPDIQKLADKLSARFIPVVLIIAVLSLVVWLTLGSHYI